MTWLTIEQHKRARLRGTEDRFQFRPAFVEIGATTPRPWKLPGPSKAALRAEASAAVAAWELAD